MQVPAADDPVVDDHDAADGHEEDGVAAEEGEEGARAGDHLPGRAERREEGAGDLAAHDVDVPGEQAAAVGADGEAVGAGVGGYDG